MANLQNHAQKDEEKSKNAAVAKRQSVRFDDELKPINNNVPQPSEPKLKRVRRVTSEDVKDLGTNQVEHRDNLVGYELSLKLKIKKISLDTILVNCFY